MIPPNNFVIPTMTIAKTPSVRLVFDRKHVATKTNKGLIQIEVSMNRKRKLFSSNVKVYKDQWDDRRHVVNSSESIELNDSLNNQVRALEIWIRDNRPFSWEKLERHINSGGASDDFVDFLRKEIDGRNDIRDSTKKSHRKLITLLEDYGGIVSFSELTGSGIVDFDNWLHGRRIRKLDRDGVEHWCPMRQQSVYDIHKIFKIYIHKAVQRGLLKTSPYVGLRFKRGESEPDRYITDEELHMIETATMRNGSTARARDLFLFQCYSGLSYADLCEFDFTKAREDHGSYLYSGRRKKTGEPFYFVILPKAMGILKKYGYKLPIISNEGLNQNLKKVAEDSGVNKPLATHWARRTAAMIFVNHGVRIEVVAKILGHSNTITTQKFYADITGDTVMNEIRRAGI